MRTPFWPARRPKKNLPSQAARLKRSSRRSSVEARLERLEDRWVLAAFTAGNIAVLDLAATSDNTTGSVLELSPSIANQANPVQTISIASSGSSALRFSDSGTSSFLSDTNDQTLLAFGAYNTTNSSVSDLATLTTSGARAVGTLDASGNFTLQTTYTEPTSGDQTRSATSLNDSSWFITDKGGLYTNGAASASLTTNILDDRSFGGTVYVSSTKAAAGVSTVSSPTATALTGLPGLPADKNIQDFYLVQSGHDGSTYDLLYTLDQNSSNATINKFSLVSGSWAGNGTYTLASNAESMIAENDAGGGAYLYLTTTSGSADNSLVQLTDTAGWNAAINVTSNVTLYTAAGSDTLKGLDFVPSSATVPKVSSPVSSDVGISTATLGGTVTSTGSQPVAGYGVVYSLTSTNSNPTIGGPGVTQLAGSGSPVFSPFTVSAAGLQGTSQYSFAAYAINNAGTSYSNVATFTTQSTNPPTIDKPTSSSVTQSSATLGGTVESNGGASITKTGVVYALASVNGNPQIGGIGVTEVDTVGPVNSGAFTVAASGLSAGATYAFEAFATNSSGTTYAPATGFTTLAVPTVGSPTFTTVTSNSATLGANVTSDGGSAVTARGIVYAPTSVNSDPQIGGAGVTEVDATGTTGVFTLPVTGLSASTGYTFEAFATNAIGTTYTPAASFTTAAANVIAAWTFPVAPVSAPDNSPAPTYGSGTATTLGMTNNYTNVNGTGNSASDDVLSTSGTADPNFTANLWRVRGTPNNGWALAAPQYSQGIELDTSTVGHSNIVFAFDWYSTTQGVRDLQVQYNTGSGWVNYQGPSPTGTFVASTSDYYNAGLSPVNPTIYVNLSGVAAANNNPDLGIRLVSAYDSTGTLGNEYASASSTPGNVVPYNDSSGNWRFGNLIFYGDSTTTTTTVAANPPLGQGPGQGVTFTATVTPASGSGYPGGTVTFYDGSTQLGTPQTVTQVGSTNVGTASVTLSTLSPGVHGDITAQYAPAVGSGLLASGSSMNLVVGDPTDNPISYVINAPQATGVDVSPVVGEPFTGVVATFSDGTNTNPAGFAASITWANGQTTPGLVAFAGSKNETNINGQLVNVSLFTVTGTYTYAAAGTYPLSVTVTDPNNNSATVAPTARVAYAPLHVTAGPAVNAIAGTPLNQTVATFTDPGLVANLAALNIGDPTTQFSATIDWGDGTPSGAGTITYNAGTQVFSVLGSHTYSHTGPYSVSVSVTPLTVAVERIDSSDPTNLNVVGDENSNGLTDSPSPDFIDQYAVGPTQTGSFPTGQSSLYTTSLPTVAANGGNEALTNSSYSISEGELSLSTNGQYLVTGGYNDTVSLWAPQQTFSDASIVNRVIGTVDGQGNINTTTALADAYSGDNFRGVVSTDGTQFWTAGHAGDNSDFVHYAQLGASTSTILTGPSGANDINTVEIFNGQLYEGVRKVAAGAPAGIYQIGSGLPTTSGQPQNLFIEVPQSNPLDVSAGAKPMAPFGFWMTDLPNNPNSINGVNVAYVADAEMGIARYDYNGSSWQFSYYIDATGSFLDSAYTVDSQGNISTTASFDPNSPAASADPSKAGGVRELTGRVVDGQVQLFAVTGFGIGSQPSPGGSLIEVTDPAALTVPANGLNTTDGVITLATNPTTDPSELTGVAFSPTAVVTSSAQVSPANPTISAIAGAPVVVGTGTPLTASATLAGGYLETGTVTFTLYSPNNVIVYTDTVTIAGNGSYNTTNGTTAGSAVPTVAGTYQWVASYSGDTNNTAASTAKGVTPEVAVGSGITVVGKTLYLVGGRSTNDQLDVDPAGTSDTGSTGARVQGRLAGVNLNATYSQAFTTIYIVGFGGNEEINVAPSMTIPVVVSAGNGNDHVQLGNGNDTVTLGDGNDQVIVGGGTNRIQLGNGNDLVVAGNGDNVIVTGNGNDLILAGNGDNLIVGGLGRHTILVGNGKNILIDGSVQLTTDVLEQVLGDWMASDITDAANLLTPAVTFNASDANTLIAGKGFDWFWATYAKDRTDRKPTDLLN